MRPAAGIREAKVHDFLHGNAGLNFVHRVAQRLNGDSVSGIDYELGFLGGIEPAPLSGVLIRRQYIVLASGFSCSAFF